MLIDSHCHIHDCETFDFAFSRAQISHKMIEKYPDMPRNREDFLPEEMIKRAHSNNVMQMICVGTSHSDSIRACEFAKKNEAKGIFWSYGIHPDEASAEINASLPVASSRLVAIGEIGLDYHGKTIAENGPDFREKQRRLFEEMIQIAVDNDLPLIFHIREAYDDFFEVIKNFPRLRGVVHSFSDSDANMRKSLDEGFYIGINGMVTFLDDISLPPLERILLETDAPFLTPKPFRGTINEPAYIKNICAFISKVKGESERQVAQITTENAKKLFNF